MSWDQIKFQISDVPLLTLVFGFIYSNICDIILNASPLMEDMAHICPSFKHDTITQQYIRLYNKTPRIGLGSDQNGTLVPGQQVTFRQPSGNLQVPFR